MRAVATSRVNNTVSRNKVAPSVLTSPLYLFNSSIWFTMGSVPSSTDTTASDGPGPPLACVLHTTRRVVADSSTPLSFKTRARNQILRLHRELLDERERHEQVVKELHDRNTELAVSLSSRVEYSEAQWSRLQQRMSDLWLEVKGLELEGHSITTKSDASVQTLNGFTTNCSTQTPEAASKDRSTQTREHGHPNLRVEVSAVADNDLKRWQTAFSHLSGTPEQMALSSKATDKALREWRTAFEGIPGTPAQKAASSKEAINELKEWRTSFNHVGGTPAQRAEASKTFLRKFSFEQKKNLDLVRSENAHREQNQTLKAEIHQLQERNLNLSTELEREISMREKLLRAFKEYQGTSNSQNETGKLISPTGPRLGPEINNHLQSPNSGHLPKRKREVSEPDRQQAEPLPASQRRRVEYSNFDRSQCGSRKTSVEQKPKPQNVSRDQHPAESSTMRSIPPARAPTGSSRGPTSIIPTGPRSTSVQCPTSHPMGLSGVTEDTRRNSESIGTFAPGRVLDTRRPSIASATGSLCANESMPKPPWPLEEKWKHSMLRKEQ